jgi:hypothetical protein
MTDMLLKYETLDRQDVLDIMAGNFNEETKNDRLKSASELYKKSPPPLPPTDLSPQMT